jgi:hypothetical protein
MKKEMDGRWYELIQTEGDFKFKKKKLKKSQIKRSYGNN